MARLGKTRLNSLGLTISCKGPIGKRVGEGVRPWLLRGGGDENKINDDRGAKIKNHDSVVNKKLKGIKTHNTIMPVCFLNRIQNMTCFKAYWRKVLRPRSFYLKQRKRVIKRKKNIKKKRRQKLGLGKESFIKIKWQICFWRISILIYALNKDTYWWDTIYFKTHAMASSKALQYFLNHR